MSFRMVLVEWIDSMGGSNWEHLSGRKPTTPATVQSVGWLLTDEETYIELALSIAEPGSDKEQASHIVSIPRVAVTSIVDVKTDVKKR